MKKNSTSVRKSKKQNTPLYIIIWLMLVGINTKAITYTWNKAAGGLWTTNTNWTPNSPVGGPAAGSDIIFIKTSADITAIPTIMLNSMTLNSGAVGSCWLESSASGNLITVSSSLTVANGYTLGIGISGARLEITFNSGCIATINGWFGMDAGTTTRAFTVNSGATLIVGSQGLIYDPSPSGGDDFIISSGATMKIANTAGIVTTAYAAAPPATGYSVAIWSDGGVTYSPGANYEYNGVAAQAVGNGLTQNTPANLTISNTIGIVTLGANLTMTGVLTIALSTTLAAGALTHTLKGSMINDGVFTANTSAIIFGGTIAQTISGSSATSFHSFTLNNPLGVSLFVPIKVSTLFTLTSGVLTTDFAGVNILTMQNNSTFSPATFSAASTSYINGPMMYQLASTTQTNLWFPIGETPDCRPCKLTVQHTTFRNYNYTAQLFDSSAMELTYTMPATVDTVSGKHYYTINRTDSTGAAISAANLSGNQSIELFYGANDNVVNAVNGKLTIVKNTAATPTTWIDIGGTNAAGSVTSTSAPSAFNSFSIFALGNKTNGGNPLPIQLLSFNAILNGEKVDITWETATEENNDYFTIEKSKDGINFTKLNIANSEGNHGNSTKLLSYQTTDANPLIGVSYYCLKQTDYNNNSKYFNVVSIDYEDSKNITSIIYPNPNNGSFVIEPSPSLTLPQGKGILVQVYDVNGKMVLSQTINGKTTIDASSLNEGVYNISLLSNEGVVNKRVVIVR